MRNDYIQPTVSIFYVNHTDMLMASETAVTPVIETPADDISFSRMIQFPEDNDFFK